MYPVIIPWQWLAYTHTCYDCVIIYHTIAHASTFAVVAWNVLPTARSHTIFFSFSGSNDPVAKESGNEAEGFSEYFCTADYLQ